jgi:hypothetical protein
MKKGLLVAILALLMVSLVAAGCLPTVVLELPESPHPAPPKEWSRTFSRPDSSDVATSVQQTACGGFIITGTTMVTDREEPEYELGHEAWLAKHEAWLVKTDPEGNKEWSRTFGGPDGDWASSVQQTAEGGFIIAGTTRSFGQGEGDFWLVKTDPEGNKEWSRTFGGPASESAANVEQTTDGGFIIVGITHSFGEGESDFWLVKTDPQGNKEWSLTFGGPDWDRASSVQQTADGGFVIASATHSFGKGRDDFWLVKTDPQGNKEWSRTFGGPYDDSASALQQTADGGFIITGTTYSFDQSGGDFWLVKTDSQGNKEWRRTFGRHYLEVAYSVQQTACDGFVIAGQVLSGRPIHPSSLWVVRTDPQGRIKWTYPSGRRAGFSCATSIKQTACGGFIIAGWVLSDAGDSDFWLIKLAPER